MASNARNVSWKLMVAGLVSGLLIAGCGGSGAHRSSGSSVSSPLTSIPFHLTEPNRAQNCQEAAASGSAEALVSAFRAARLSGRGAEGCLTAAALSRYCGPRPCGPGLFSGPKAPSPGPICLYACNDLAVRAIALEGAERDRSGALWVTLMVSGQSGGTARTIDNEELRLGAGVPSTSSLRQPMVILDASTLG